MQRILMFFFYFYWTIFIASIEHRTIVAVGYGLSNGSFALALMSYFRLKLNRASGVAMTLAGIGPIIYPPMIQYLQINYGVDGCMLIIGAFALHMLIGAVLLQPIEWHLVSPSNDVEAKAEKTCDFTSNCSLCEPSPIRTVTTVQSIGKFSDISCMYYCIFHKNIVDPILNSSMSFV